MSVSFLLFDMTEPTTFDPDLPTLVLHDALAICHHLLDVRFQRNGQVETPAKLLAPRPQEIDWPRIDLRQIAVIVPQETLGEGILDGGGRRRKGRDRVARPAVGVRSEEHTSELQSLMRISYAGFFLKKKNR